MYNINVYKCSDKEGIINAKKQKQFRNNEKIERKE